MSLLLQQIVNGLVLGGAYVLIALGLFLVFTALHIPNFAHGEMYALGAFLQYTLVVGLGMNFFVGVALSAVGVAVIGALLEISVFRRLASRTLITVLVGSLALSIVIQELLVMVWGKDVLAVPAPMQGMVQIGGIRITTYRLLIIVVVMVVAAIAGWLVYRTSYGRQVRALAQNREIAEMTAINVGGIGTITFALGAGLAGIAGALLAPTVAIEPRMGFHPTLVAFMILVVVGGGGRMLSIVLGGFLIAAIEVLAGSYISHVAQGIVVFALLVVFLSVRPEGAIRQGGVQKVTL
ncbi:amino acid/amide ABC transporter membrane protein 1 (HAAT family) [Antricoccus suffuscus]|uniref:Amino acid/amide ABC transporter membrane protein 1 (HAAT family) n=1 Tax=Antricoccus suffuscus TaxID=1629062 RepID=A0A2T0ZX63_9ACTN|nr:branched-chain amino acid ABC transporter permease [Antricoccus suffuscus]PRZ40864.1 amino acid/amide ABC transporter membrane protein 1 (HAAT family) [Antricoccus suffuscus]